MRGLKRAVIVAAALLLAAGAAGGQSASSSTGAEGALTAVDIVRRMQSNQVYQTSRMRGRMTVSDRFGTKVTTFVSWSRGATDSLIEFTSTEEKGQKILRTRDEIYLFYPGAEELIRLQGAAFRDAVLGSDMSYEDLTGGKTILELYEVSLEGREMVDGADCWRIAMKAKGRNVAYPRQLMWVDPALWSPRRMQQFSLSNRLLKESRLSDFREVSGRMVPTRVILEDKLKKGSSTEFTVQEIEIGIPLDPSLFSLEKLTW
jgi:outer membrane lipoprotein-sorting protein